MVEQEREMGKAPESSVRKPQADPVRLGRHDQGFCPLSCASRGTGPHILVAPTIYNKRFKFLCAPLHMGFYDAAVPLS
jgi:hypothetical protein